jgi:DNA-binding NarL/FixJ family response regulator
LVCAQPVRSQGDTRIQLRGQLFISERTVETHVRSILNKLGFNSGAQVAAWVTEHDLLKASRISH